MDNSKSISKVLMKFKIAYPYFFKDMPKEELIGLISIYQEVLDEFNEETIEAAANIIIKKNKYMPSPAEFVEGCYLAIRYKKNEIIDKMYESGYFHLNVNDEQAKLNYHKALMFVEKEIVPEWLKEDMREYEAKMLANKKTKLLEDLK